ncbi:MULE transposase domain-containing protein [Phthorimaea operculella]|nr:MULE transposase domain-containing protein [Phthorimaea operculella]
MSTESSGSEELIFIKNNKNKPAVLCNGFRYNWVSDNKNGNSFWRCCKRQECSASITLNESKTTIVRKSDHMCKEDYIKMSRDIVVQEAKEKVCNSMAAVKKIYEKVVVKCQNENKYCEQLPSFKSIKDTLHRCRKKFLEVSCTEFGRTIDVEIPNMIKCDFLVCECEIDADKKIILFSSLVSRKAMKRCVLQNKMCFGDGTFGVVPKPFFQLFTIFADVNSCVSTTNVLPMIYALLPDKTEATYLTLFTAIRDVLGIEIKIYKCDYELAQINAFRTVFPHAKISGCYFHYTRAIWRKAEEIGLTTTQDGKTLTRMTANLPLLPTSQIREGWQSILSNNFENNDAMIEFKTYFEKQWMRQPELIACCRERHRTTNMLEAWHRRMSVRMTRKPTLILFLYRLRKEARYQDLKIKGSIGKAANRTKKGVTFEKKYKQEMQKLNRHEISTYEFLSNMSEIKFRLNL